MHHVLLSMLLSLCICLSLCLTLLHECSAETRPVPTAAAKSRVAGNIEIHSRSETRTRFGKGIKVRAGKKFGDEVEAVRGDSDGTETGPEIQTSTERTMSEITKATSEARTNIKAEANSDIIKADGGSRTGAKTDAGVKTWNGLDTIYNDPDVRGMTSMNVPRWMEELILHLERTVQQQSASLREMTVWQGRVQARLAQLEAQTLRHEGKLRKLRDTGRNNSLATAHHRKEIGRLSGCLRGRWISGRCYLLFREYASHEQAASRCEETGGSLAAPSDATTRRAIARYARSAVSGNWFVWIGVTDHTAEGVYIYSDGSRVISAPWYRAYPVVQPNGGRAENCVAFTVGDGAWWDSPCNGRHLFLCQYAF